MKQNRVIEFTDVDKNYLLGEVEIKALSGISFSVKQESFTFIVGKSGSGKSTLLNLIGAIDTPSSGNISINGVELSSLDDDVLYRGVEAILVSGSIEISNEL